MAAHVTARHAAAKRSTYVQAKRRLNLKQLPEQADQSKLSTFSSCLKKLNRTATCRWKYAPRTKCDRKPVRRTSQKESPKGSSKSILDSALTAMDGVRATATLKIHMSLMWLIHRRVLAPELMVVAHEADTLTDKQAYGRVHTPVA